MKFHRNRAAGPLLFVMAGGVVAIVAGITGIVTENYLALTLSFIILIVIMITLWVCTRNMERITRKYGRMH